MRAAGVAAQAIPSVTAVLDAVAAERYGERGPMARTAWTAFSTAFRNNTRSISARSTIAPCTLVRPIRSIPKRRAMRATDGGYPYDDLTQWRGPYPAEMLATQFEKVAAGWRSGIGALKLAAEKAPPDRRAENQAELQFAEAAYTNFQSVANQARFILARDALADPSRTIPPDERHRLRAEIGAACKPRSLWPGGSSRSRVTTRGSVLRPGSITFTCRRIWWRKSSIAAGCWTATDSPVAPRLPRLARRKTDGWCFPTTWRRFRNLPASGSWREMPG